MISTTLRRRLTGLPLPLLMSAPGLVAAAATAVAPEHAVLAGLLAALAAVAIAALVTRQLVLVGRKTPVVGRELLNLHTRMIRETGNADVLKRVVGASRDRVSTAAQTTSQLLAELVRAEESTRAHLAGELHDTVAQSLARALVQLDDLPVHHLEGLESLREAEEQLRAVLARIRPPELAQGDLASAIADLCAEMRNRYGVDVAVTWPATSVPLPGPLATTTYRFVQHSLLNAVEHADGVGVRLDVRITDADELEVVVSDRGPGFRLEDVDSSLGRHLGLRLARERARVAGGGLDVLSRIGVGTTVRLRLPLSDGQQALQLRSA